MTKSAKNRDRDWERTNRSSLLRGAEWAWQLLAPNVERIELLLNNEQKKKKNDESE